MSESLVLIDLLSASVLAVDPPPRGSTASFSDLFQSHRGALLLERQAADGAEPLQTALVDQSGGRATPLTLVQAADVERSVAGGMFFKLPPPPPVATSLFSLAAPQTRESEPHGLSETSFTGAAIRPRSVSHVLRASGYEQPSSLSTPSSGSLDVFASEKNEPATERSRSEANALRSTAVSSHHAALSRAAVPTLDSGNVADEQPIATTMLQASKSSEPAPIVQAAPLAPRLTRPQAKPVTAPESITLPGFSPLREVSPLLEPVTPVTEALPLDCAPISGAGAADRPRDHDAAQWYSHRPHRSPAS